MSQNRSHLRLDNPASYCICVQGTLDSGWLAMLSGEWVVAAAPTAQPGITVLEGQVRDQAALVGALEQLYSPCYLLSVWRLARCMTAAPRP